MREAGQPVREEMVAGRAALGGVEGKRMPDFESVKALTVTFGETTKGGTEPLGDS